MDENVAMINDLLEKNYKIIKMEMDVSRASSNALEYTVTLEKGHDKEVIRSSSNDFQKYMIHFKKMRNKYGNDEFVYIDDLDNYERQTKGLFKDQIYIEDKHIIKIMGHEFRKGIITLLFRPSSINNKTGISMFRIDLSTNPEFIYCDLKDEFEVYERSNDKLVFAGFVKRCAVQNDNTALIILQDTTLKLENTRLSVEFINMNPVECASTLASSMGLDFHTNLNINKNKRTFIVIIPVKNLIISDDFKIGNVEFYQKFNTLDDHLIRKSDNGRTNLEWNGNYPRSKIIINAISFLSAIQDGYRRISAAVDLISLRTDISFPEIKIKDRNEYFSFDYYKYFSRVKIPPWVYCREKDTNSYTLFNIEFQTENVLALEYNPQDYFLRLDGLFGELEHAQYTDGTGVNISASLGMAKDFE